MTAQPPRVRPVCVTCTGPESDIDPESGDEIPVWCVCTESDDGEIIGNPCHYHDLDSARHMARKIAREHNLDLVDESMTP